MTIGPGGGATLVINPYANSRSPQAFQHSLGAPGSMISGADFFAAAGLHSALDIVTGISSGGSDALAFQVLGLLESAFGDGSDGDHTVVGTETLTRDMYYRNLTVPAGTIIITNAFRLFVSGNLDIDAGGIIHNDGAIGVAGAGGAGGKGGGNAIPGAFTAGAAADGNSVGTLGCGANGAGTNLVGGSAGESVGGYAGQGDDATWTPTVFSIAYLTLLPYILVGTNLSGIRLNGGAGGTGTGGTGGAGGGGGVVLISARNIRGTGTIRANGGAGAAAHVNNRGGGGGALLIAFGALADTVTLQANAGNNGSGTNTGKAGTILRAHVVG